MSRQVKKVNISGKEDKSNKVSSWSNTTTDTHYPSEKLVKDSLDGKANSTHTHSQYLTEHQDLSNYVTTDDSRLSDARTPTSHTHTKSQITDFPTIPSASSTVPSADTTNGSYGSGTSYARSNHTHPKSSLYAESSHTHSQYLTEHQSLANYVQKSSTSGLLKNDGSVDTTQYLSSLPSHNHDDRYYTESEVDTALNGKANSSHTHTKSQITDFPSIPSKTSDLTNDSGFITSSSLPTKVSDLQNDTGFITSSALPTKTSDLTNDGDGSNVFVKDNDSRLSDARTPLAHTHLSSDVTDLIDVIYPVGSIYMSVNSVNPSTLFGGQWEQIEDKFLLASGTSYSNGATGGSADATLVSHQHGTSYTGEYFVTSESDSSNNTRVSYNASGNRWVDGMTASSTPFHHRVGTGYVGSSATGKNMPPYLAVNVWKRIA